MIRNRIRRTISAFAKSVIETLRLDRLSPGERALAEMFNSGGPSWRPHPHSSMRRTGAAAIQRAARRQRNIRARAAK